MLLIDTIALSALTAFIIIGAHIVTNWEGMLLRFVYDGYDAVMRGLEFEGGPYEHGGDERKATWLSWLIKHLCKPVFTCPYCMSSVWTIAVRYAYTGSLSLFVLFNILCTCGIVAVLWSFIDKD